MSQYADITSHHIEGIAAHGDTPFSIPLISEVGEFQNGRLFHGGFGPVTPSDFGIEGIVSLYPWEKYAGEYDIHAQFRMYDASGLVPERLLYSAVTVVSDALAMGLNVLVHCQAGLNRSSLVVGEYLKTREDMSGPEAVALIREKRSDACLCNPDFEAFVRA